jgi:hypothetical protein
MECRSCGKDTRVRDKKKYNERWGLCSSCYRKDQEMFKIGIKIATNR